MDEDSVPIFFGDWLKERRRTLDLTQAELAQRVGCTVFALRKIESGERRPSKQLAQLLALSLGVAPEEQDAFVKAARGETLAERLRQPTQAPHTHHAAAPSPALPPVHHLPVMLTPLIGREPELAALSRLLDDPLCRLITLIGAGGIGKTRLAIEAAARNQARFADGVFFVSLASLSSSAYLVPAIADALDFGFQGQIEPRIQLLEHLCEKRLLLVLDNVEHLLDSVGLFAELLQHAPGVKLLVTSRERLNLQSEWVYVVQGLPVPPDERVDNIADYTAIQLFVQSARRTRADFELTGDERPAVVRICQMVEGMPLGIELAATWVSALSGHEISNQIEHSLDFLTTSMRDVPNRQRSLRAVFEHSWRLLTAEEQGVLSRLAVFRGGFAQEAADAVAGARLPALLALQSKSLIRRKENGQFDLHEVVRQYALSHLERDPQNERAHQSHCEYFLTLLRDQEAALKGAAQLETIRKLKDSIDNIHVAWTWAVGREQFSLIDEALRSFGWLCHIGVLYREGIEEIELAVQALRSRPEDDGRQAVLGKALAQQGLLYFRQGRFDQAVSLLEESLVILRPLGNAALMTDPLVLTGVIMHLSGDYKRAHSLLEEGYAKAQEADDRFYTAYALYNLGYIASQQGRYAEGYEQMLTGLTLWRKLGDPSSIALGLNYLSQTAIHLGRPEEAQAFLQESLALLTPIGERWGMGTAYRLLGLAALAKGHVEDAISYVRKSLALIEGIITGWDVACSLIYLGEATAAAGDLAEAGRMFRNGLHTAMESQATPLMLDALAGWAALQLETGDAAAAWEMCAVVQDHPAGTFATRQRACHIRAKAENMLTADQVRTAQQRAPDHSLQELVNRLLAE